MIGVEVNVLSASRPVLRCNVSDGSSRSYAKYKRTHKEQINAMPKPKRTKNKNQKEAVAVTQAESISPATENLVIDARAENARDQTEVAVDSLEASIEFPSLLRELHHAFVKRVAFYRSTAGGSYSLEEARKAAYHPCTDVEEAAKHLDKLRSYPVDRIDFGDMLPLMNVAPDMAEDLWREMKVDGLLEFESGHLASKASMPTPHMRTPWNAASFLGLRASFRIDWEPRGGLELALIDMLAQAYLQFQYWVKESVLRTQSEPRREAEDYLHWKKHKRSEYKAEGWDPGWWDIPYVREQEAIEHAAQMADRWNRTFMRILRNLRDLRRYSTVTINNPQQVNIAADGGQQINLATDEKKDE
jgi:hypothetical protein